MLFLYWPNTILPYKMAAVEQETYGNKLAPYVVYTTFHGQSPRKLKLVRAEPSKITTSSGRALETYNLLGQSPRNVQLARAKPSKRTTSSGKALETYNHR